MNSERRRQVAALLPLALLLVAVAVSAHAAFDPAIAGDHDAELEYLRYLDEHRRLPLATEGFAMYHPPAYYVISVAVSKLGMGLVTAARTVATVAWVLEGLVAGAIVRRLGGRGAGMAAAVALVWLLPGQANVATRIYMETTVGLGVGLALLGLVELHQGRRSGYWWLGIGVPLAGLSKFSGLVALAVILPALAWSQRARLRQLVAALAPGLALMAAFYGRNVVHFGTPAPLNADLFRLKDLGGLYAARPPGFFTRLALGPCAAEHSFYGSAWKWLWATDCSVKAPWRDTVTGWLLVVALLTTVVVAAAWCRAALAGRRDVPWLAVAGIPAAVFVAFVGYTLRVPSGSSGLYLLVALVPVAVALGGLVSGLPQRLDRLAYAGVLAWGVAMAAASGVGP